MSIAEFARQMGVFPRAVQSKIENGRIAAAVLPDGSLDHVQARALWFANSDASKITKPKPRGGKRKDHAGEAEEADGAFQVKLRRMRVDLESAEIELEKLKGSTVDKEEARKAIRAFARVTRDHMLNFANRYGPAIAAELGVDSAAIIALIDARIRDALNEAAASPAPFDVEPGEDEDAEAA